MAWSVAVDRDAESWGDGREWLAPWRSTLEGIASRRSAALRRFLRSCGRRARAGVGVDAGCSRRRVYASSRHGKDRRGPRGPAVAGRPAASEAATRLLPDFFVVARG